MKPRTLLKTEKLIRDLLASLLKNRKLEPDLICTEIIPQFESLLLQTIDGSHSNFWLEDIQAQAKQLFRIYNE